MEDLFLLHDVVQLGDEGATEVAHATKKGLHVVETILHRVGRGEDTADEDKQDKDSHTYSSNSLLLTVESL